MEADIAGDVSDSQATAAAERAVASADEDEEAPENHSNQQIQKETPSAKDVKAAEVASAKDKVAPVAAETTTVKDVVVPQSTELAKKAEVATVKAAPPAPKKRREKT